ncbi:MAG: hypothetical protein CVV06_11105 [Gammaproteobacteria bacterium HGW-Gammaproteobacteria-10]|nr:MAG: hypothetical protein CVV06_11105 [Gammaproteobacteria bacterium HGW-Gammaproteobacteria-10]
MRILLCLLLAAFTAHADSKSAVQTEENTLSHALPPEKLDAIRLIGRNVLQAKNIAKQESSDKAQLNQLRSTLEKLIAVETPISRTGVLSLFNKATATPGTQQIVVPSARKADHTQAWDEISKLRQKAGQLHRQKNKPAKAEIYSSGFPIGEQHGRLYDELADKLETILNSNSTDRVAQLSALRDRLNTKKQAAVSASLTPETPTAQASPWKDPEAPNPKTQRKSKSSQ